MTIKARHSCERGIKIKTPLAFLDLETTGITVGIDRVVEIGVFKVMPEGASFDFNVRVNPEIPIPREAREVHGIRDEDVQNSRTFADIAVKLAEFLRGCDLAGYNLVRFDLPILEAEFQRVGQPWQMDGRAVVDLMAIYHRKEPRDLKAAHRFYCGTEHENAHSAFADARACWDVLRGQIRMYPDLPDTPAGLSAITAERKKPRALDSGGWFDTRDGQPAFARGKHRGILVSEVAATAPDYLDWMLTLGLPQDTIAVIRRNLPGERR
jgi:DNA polymerase III subunit epsilon